MSILTVTLNACVDKAYTVPGFAAGRIFRPAQAVTTPGGKGINVARVFRTLGGEAVVTGFLGGANGDSIEAGLRTEGIPAQCVRIGGESRVCIKVMDPETGVETELNEHGPLVTEQDASALMTSLRELLPGRVAVVISGSMPPGAPADLYRRMVSLAQQELGIKAVLDTSGPALADAAHAQPYLLKPNVHELDVLKVGGDGWVTSVQALHRQYRVPLAMITGGARGAVVTNGISVWEAVPPPVHVVSAVGSGDSLTAAFVWGLLSGYTMEKALQLGVGAGAANATTAASGFCPRELILEYADRTRVNKYDRLSV